MAYCTLDDILGMIDEEDVIRHTDDFDTGTVNTSATDRAIAGADALIDSYIGSRYSVPVSPVPDIIRDLSVDIAIYKICSRRDQTPVEARKKYDDAKLFLEKISAGTAVITGAAPAPV